MYKNKNTFAAFLDVESAYDNVRSGILIKKLMDMRCPTKIVRMVKAWTSTRRIRFVIDEGEVVLRT